MPKNISVILTIVLVSLLLFVAFKVFANGAGENPADVVQVKATYSKITAQQAKEIIDSGKSLVILDVRTPGEFAGGHIESAINIANETIGSERPSLLPDLDATILVYCRSGSRSAQASKKLLALGYTDVHDFGGIINWPYETVQ